MSMTIDRALGELEGAKMALEPKAANLREAVEFEFDLPLPNGRKYNRHQELISILNLNREAN